MSRWSEFYRPRLGPEYLAYVKQRYAPFIDIVLSHIRPGDGVGEAGAGMGTITRALLDFGSRGDHVCLELDGDMLELADYQVGLRSGMWQLDIREQLPRVFDVIHGHGVLEHFSDCDIRKIIHTHRESGARAAIHYVPGEKYVTPSFGDERLMSVDAWREIAAPDEVVTFNDGFDYALIWRFQ